MALISIAVVCAGGVLALDRGSASRAAGGSISLPRTLPGYKDIVTASIEKAPGSGLRVVR